VSTDLPFFAFAEITDGSEWFEFLPFPQAYERHLELASHLSGAFPGVLEVFESCSYIQLVVLGQKVSVDNFWSRRHQIKSATDGEHVSRVIAALNEKYHVVRYERPREGGYGDSEVDVSP